MTGAQVRGYYPVFWNGTCHLATDNRVDRRLHQRHRPSHDEGRLWRETAQQVQVDQGRGRHHQTLPAATPSQLRPEQNHVRQQMIDGSTAIVLRAEVADGSEPVIYAVGYHATKMATPFPPVRR